ncbi:MAG TPA: hypothetical protein VGM90_06715 [Kofleriaceae bacterium]|jgi:hypothetical protein
MVNRFVCAALVASLAACGGSKKEEPKAPEAATVAPPVEEKAPAVAPVPVPVEDPAAKQACVDRSAKLGAHLDELAKATPGFVPLEKSITSPASAKGKAIDGRGFVVGVGKDGTYYWFGQKLQSLEDVNGLLDAAYKKSLETFIMDGGSLQTAKFNVYVFADKDAPASAVADIVALAKKESGDKYVLRLLVGGKGATPDAKAMGGAQAIADKLPASEPDATKYMVDQLKTSIGSCDAVITVIATSDSTDLPSKTAAKLSKGLPDALVKCQCKVANFDALEWGMSTWFGATAPALAYVDMPAIKKGEKKPIGKLVK